MSIHSRGLFLLTAFTAVGCTQGPNEEFRGYTSVITLSGGDDGSCTSADVDVTINPRRSLFETSQTALSLFSMTETLSAIATNAGAESEPATLHDQLIDTYNVGPGLGLGGHCDDQHAANGQTILNGHPIRCPRNEGLHIGDIDGWFPIAAVNRFDLAPTDGANCGEARLVFANNNQNRMFVIFEAKVPNPDPECGLDACIPVQQFFAGLSAIDKPGVRAEQLHAAFITGHEKLQEAGFGPFMTAGAFSVGQGQIRTNNFDTLVWTLREFKLVANQLSINADPTTATKVGPPNPLPIHVRAVEVPVAANPHGPIFNENLKHPHGEKCRAAFLETIPALMSDNPNLMSVSMPSECLAAESENNFSNRYDLQLNNSPGFSAQIADVIHKVDPTSTLTPTNIGMRAAFSGACIGCHQETNGQPLGNGVVAPSSAVFVHTSEIGGATSACGDGHNDCFAISPAVSGTFLPHRQSVMEQFLSEGGCCEVVFDDGPFDPPPLEIETLDQAAIIEAEAAADAEAAPMTVGGASSQRAH